MKENQILDFLRFEIIFFCNFLFRLLFVNYNLFIFFFFNSFHSRLFLVYL